MKCDFCAYRYGWECGDEWNRYEDCEEFKLDWDTLSDKQKKAIMNHLSNDKSETKGEY